ncbi:hypothetical protein BLOT_002186 [Blomia tropicalis]|nr:hypothetical protein BLOT_002186 [Blomia tropicalis]
MVCSCSGCGDGGGDGGSRDSQPLSHLKFSIDYDNKANALRYLVSQQNGICGRSNLIRTKNELTPLETLKITLKFHLVILTFMTDMQNEKMQ